MPWRGGGAHDQEAARRPAADGSRKTGPLSGQEGRWSGSCANCGPQPVDRRSRPQRWQEAVCELVEIQASCQEWLDRLPESLAGTSTGETLEAICALDLAELETVQPPMGFGRD